jgi:hypothetical protein
VEGEFVDILVGVSVDVDVDGDLDVNLDLDLVATFDVQPTCCRSPGLKLAPGYRLQA